MSDHDPAALDPGAQPVSGSPPIIEHAPEPERVAPAGPQVSAAPVRRGGTPLPLTLLLTAALGGGGYYAWTHPSGAPPQAADPTAAIEQARSQLQAQVQPLSDQLQLLAGRVDALEKHQAAPAPSPGSDAAPAGGLSADAAKQLSDLSARLDALSSKQDGQAAEIQKVSEIAAQRPTEPAAAPPDATAAQAPAFVAQQQVADLGHRVDDAVAKQTAAEQALAQQKAAADALDQRLAKLEAGAQGQAQAAQQESANAQSAVAQKLAVLDARIGKLEQGQGAVQGAAQGATRAVRLEAAEAALSAGQPLGQLPGASPALTRYATQAPPTDAALRARFPAVAEAARAASQPDVSQRSFLDRMLARVQQSVTVRRGDHVIVGDPASGVLARAQDAVDRDDLKDAADTLGQLTGPAADATHDWVAQVRGLLEARAALAAMARG